MWIVQLCRRSRHGLVIPYGWTKNRKLVREVAAAIIDELEQEKTGDEVWDEAMQQTQQMVARAVQEVSHAEE
jgi:ABC-type glycerol-3-phosphate transport system substrate-binding protein